MARTEILQDALSFAAAKHSGQWRDGASPLPYITHPIEVVANLRYVGGVVDEDILAAGFLHDVLEETDATAAEIEKLFGSRVRGLVESVTRQEPTDEDVEGMTPNEVYELRSKLLLSEIAEMSAEAQAIKLADRLSNVIGARATKPRDKYKRYIDQTRELLRIIPKSVNVELWTAVRKASGIRERDL